MLIELNIKNFAIIDDINVRFTKGLNLLTGETGAGKSIIIEALGIILGGRGTKDLIQNGKDKAILQALFIVDEKSKSKKVLDKYGVDIDEDGLLLITRELSLDHPSISRVNGRTVTLGVLRDISSVLIDIFAQEEHQSLLDVSNHKRLIDSFGDEDFINKKKEYYENYIEYVELKKDLKDVNIDPIQREREIEFLKFQIDEIRDGNLTDDDKNLDEEFNRIHNLSEISDGVRGINTTLRSDSYDDITILDILNKDISILSDLVRYDKELESILDRFKDINYELQDISGELDNYLEKVDLDDERLYFLTDRINVVNNLKKKYGNTIDDILSYGEKITDELESLLDYEDRINNLDKLISEKESYLKEKGREISDLRKDMSGFLEQSITEELNELNMSNVKFKVEFKELDYIGEDGLDDIEFLISTNKGEELKPLSRIVSGGEMSRIMLGFKSILAEYDGIPTMIFDEIDTGISGRTAQIVGEKIAKISNNHQVITITHLPQIAALADSHYLISKHEDDYRVITNVERLDEEERIVELARLLGGVNVTDRTLDHAREMIEMSEELKNTKK